MEERVAGRTTDPVVVATTTTTTRNSTTMAEAAERMTNPPDEDTSPSSSDGRLTTTSTTAANESAEDRKMPAKNKTMMTQFLLDREGRKRPALEIAEERHLPQITQPEILELLLAFALPSPRKVTDLTVKKQSMLWLAKLRGVNRFWKMVIDDPSSQLWFLLAHCQDMDPPKQLFSGGTYQQVCKILLDHEYRMVREQQELDRIRQSSDFYGFTGCVIRMPQPRGQHPNPSGHQIKLPLEVSNRISGTAQGLEEFLRSINYDVLKKRSSGDDHDYEASWHELVLIRYRMFLYLKQKYPKTWIIPTAEIEFCWLAHIFRTKNYWADLSRLGINHNHCLQLNKSETAVFVHAVQATDKLWCSEFGCEYLPGTFSVADWAEGIREQKKHRYGYLQGDLAVPLFQPYAFLPMSATYNVKTTNSSRVTVNNLPTISLTAAEIRADLEWFPQLQVGLEVISHEEYNVLNRRSNKVELYKNHLVPSYERFLNLCFTKEIPNAAPPYVLDLIWHAHQADPVAYKVDCKSLFGGEFWHHPWPNGLGVSTEVSSSLKRAWKEAYGTTMEEDWQLQGQVNESTAQPALVRSHSVSSIQTRQEQMRRTNVPTPNNPPGEI